MEAINSKRIMFDRIEFCPIRIDTIKLNGIRLRPACINKMNVENITVSPDSLYFKVIEPQDAHIVTNPENVAWITHVGGNRIL